MDKTKKSNNCASTLNKSDLSYFPVKQIQVARENDLLYEQFAIANVNDLALVKSIQELGIKVPLTLSADGFLLSGHRRFSATKYLGDDNVPVRFTKTIFAELSKTERPNELRLFNHQREKTPGEKIREQLLEIDPDEAYFDLLRRRINNINSAVSSKVDLGKAKKRSCIKATQILFQQKLRDAIEGVIDADAFNAQIELEKEDAAIVEAYRREVLEAIGDVDYG